MLNFSKVAVVAAFALSNVGQAVFIPGYERPILRSNDMKIVNPVRGFEKINRADMTLTRKDGSGSVQPTGIIVKLHGKTREEDRTVRLVISDIRKDSCGSTHYNANLPTNMHTTLDSDANMYARFHVGLVDHSTRLCEDFRPYRWEANVSEGFGWCGTMDARMTLLGNPEPVFTPSR